MDESDKATSLSTIQVEQRGAAASNYGYAAGEETLQAKQLDEWATVRKLAHKQLNRFMKIEPKVLRGDLPNALHDLRVASRRLQQVLDLLYPEPRSHEVRRLRKKVRRSRRCLSDTRNRDVLIERVENVLSARRASRRSAREALLHFLRERRAASFKKAARKLVKINLAAVYVELRRLLNPELQGTPPHERHSEGGEELTPALFYSRIDESLSNVWRRFESQLALSQTDSSPAVLHGARIATKRLRYLLEVVAAFGISEAKPNLAWLRGLQRLLGEWHDLEVLEQSMIEMVARRDFLREQLSLAMEIEKLIVRNRVAKKKMEVKYFRMAFDSPEAARLKHWVSYLVSSPSEAFGAAAD